MKTFVVPLLAFVWCVTVSAGEPVKGFKTASVNIGYMRDEEFGRRVTVPDLAGYFKRLEAECAEFFNGATTPENLDVVVAVKPGKVSRVWFVSSRTPTAGEKRDALRAKLEGIPAPDVVGAIAFAIEGKIAGGDPKAAKESGPPPVPVEWKNGIAKLDSSTQFDEMLAAVWPGGPASAKTAGSPGDDFVTQTLDPTEGKILKPKGWFYSENHRDTAFDWTLSKEDASGGRKYTTGVRIQAYVGVKERTGKTAKEFILDFLTAKKKEAAKLVETCEAQVQGMFTRICIETDEGSRHMMYSLFWGNEGLDIAVIMEAGTTKELWKTYEGMFNRMNRIELIDMKRIEAKQAFKVPDGVRYKEATAAVNEEAKQLLLKKFSAKSTDEDVLSLFSAKLICGPGLWKQIKDDNEMAKLTKGNVSLHVDAETLEGKLFQTPEEVLLFWKAFTKAVDTGSFKVRKLSEEEITIFWAMISFDIEEPLYILESPQHKILVLMVADKGLKIMWIDDFRGFRMRPKTP